MSQQHNDSLRRLLLCVFVAAQNFGGNIDNRRIGKGATMYYPVQVSLSRFGQHAIGFLIPNPDRCFSGEGVMGETWTNPLTPPPA